MCRYFLQTIPPPFPSRKECAAPPPSIRQTHRPPHPFEMSYPPSLRSAPHPTNPQRLHRIDHSTPYGSLHHQSCKTNPPSSLPAPNLSKTISPSLSHCSGLIVARHQASFSPGHPARSVIRSTLPSSFSLSPPLRILRLISNPCFNVLPPSEACAAKARRASPRPL